jgi:AraC-like DNA-binding protein/quercetin dioxygenase-like cupin family protein
MARRAREEQEEAVLRVAGGSDRLEILRAEYRRHCFAPHFHETFAVGLVDRGAVAIGYRGATHLLRPGAVLVIEPGEVHTAHSADGGAWSYRSLYPSAALLAEAAGWGGGEGEVPFFGGGVYADAALAAQVGALHRALDAGGDPLAQDVLAREACAALARRYGRRGAGDEARGEGREPAARPRRDPGAVARMRDFRHAHVVCRVTLADVAAAAGVSEFHCIRLFRRATGVPPYAYLDLLRVARAKGLIERGMAISQVAYAAGFSDQSHLTRRFKRVVGVTPGAYARRTGGGGAGSIVQAGARRVG